MTKAPKPPKKEESNTTNTHKLKKIQEIKPEKLPITPPRCTIFRFSYHSFTLLFQQEKRTRLPKLSSFSAAPIFAPFHSHIFPPILSVARARSLLFCSPFFLTQQGILVFFVLFLFSLFHKVRCCVFFGYYFCFTDGPPVCFFDCVMLCRLCR